MTKNEVGTPESHVYAHELGHAIDGLYFEYSKNVRWHEAAAREILPDMTDPASIFSGVPNRL